MKTEILQEKVVTVVVENQIDLISAAKERWFRNHMSKKVFLFIKKMQDVRLKELDINEFIKTHHDFEDTTDDIYLLEFRSEADDNFRVFFFAEQNTTDVTEFLTEMQVGISFLDCTLEVIDTAMKIEESLERSDWEELLAEIIRIANP